jgi:hypothetical protein
MDRQPLQQFVGRATRDAVIKTRKSDGSVITDRKGNQLIGFGLAVSDGYGDDATTTYFDVTVGNPGLANGVLDKENGVLKGRLVAIEGTVEKNQNEAYNDTIWAMQVAVTAWLPRSKAGETVQAATTEEGGDF